MLEELMGSKTRSKILSLFFSHPGEEFYVREIERKIGENINSVRRELNKLLELGILLSERKGNQRYFKINEKLPIYEELKMIFIKTEGFADELKQIFKGASGIEQAFIYGSWAEGRKKLNSDIDIFIVGDVDEQTLISSLNDLEKRISREINYVIFDIDELKKRQKSEDPFIKNVFGGKKIFLVGGSLEDEKIILTKKQDVYNVFLEVSKRKGKKVSVKDIKKELKTRYGEA